MERLPYIDEHATPVTAAPDDVWRAAVATVRGAFGGAPLIARVLGCDPASTSPGFSGREGETLAGFRVIESEPGRRLALEGRHRFARYRLTFLIDPDARTAIAQTHALFPGLHGRLYRAAVIGSGAHRVVTRQLLRRVAQRAARAASA